MNTYTQLNTINTPDSCLILHDIVCITDAHLSGVHV